MRTHFLHFILLIVLTILFAGCKIKTYEPVSESKPRLIITTDIGGDPDDQQSLVRLLLYSNEFDIEGLIASSSGTPNELKKDTVKDQLILDYIQAYAKVFPVLKKHSEDYPEAELLMKLVKKGNPSRGLDNIGMGHDTEASEHLIKVIDDDEERKLNICIWGGQTDLVQALWRVKNSRSNSDYLDFISKIRVYDISDQDGLYSYIRTQFPDLFYILAKAPEGVDKREGAYRGMYLGGDESITSKEWIDSNVRTGHGPLGELYPDKTWTAPNPHGVMKEGDTPSWFYFLKNGLQDPDNPGYGGWGGRFKRDSANFFIDTKDFAGEETNARATVYRWREYFQNAFAARMDWCVSEYDEANHPPVIIIDGFTRSFPLVMEVNAGDEVIIDASRSIDPDGDDLEYYWWTYPEAGNTDICPELENYLSSTVSFIIPEGQKGQEIHVICQVNDTGDPVLTSFRRIICRLK